ncbi:MAG: SDR family NAD(P)-dependent oxidoreductase [Beijerinckiaceae bacterium]
MTAPVPETGATRDVQAGFLSRNSKKALIILHDLAMTAAALGLSLALRFDDRFLADRLAFWPYAIPFVAFAGLVYFALKLYRSKWRFASLPDLIAIAKASAVLALAMLVIDYLVLAQNLYGGYFFGRQAIAIYFGVQMALLGAPRMLYRSWKDSRAKAAPDRRDAAPALLLGRPSDVEVLLRGIETGAVKGMRPAGILSPRGADLYQVIRGVPVRGELHDLQDIVEEFEAAGTPIRRIVMTPAALAPDAGPERVLDKARRLGVPVLRMQSLEGAAPGALAPVDIEDLLLRPSHAIDGARVGGFIRGKRCVVTGGGGSIGGEICCRLKNYGAAAILIIENSELALHSITEELQREDGEAVVSGRIADVREKERLAAIIRDFRPDIVFHAAALKHVPYLETDWSEGVKTNVYGSINTAEAAIAAGAACMVMISTDKAIQPVSMLGATKRFAEMATEALDREPNGTRLISVRFGNVLGSNGSVVPKFKAQIAHGGPVTVTHPDMIRYFMTVREACDLVLTAASHAGDQPKTAASPSVYVLKMGQPVKILDLAERMIRLSGLEPGRDIEIAFSGARPGERLHEILFDQNEPMVETGLDGVMAAKTDAATLQRITRWLDGLRQALARNDVDAANAILREAIADYRPGGDAEVGASSEGSSAGSLPAAASNPAPHT